MYDKPEELLAAMDRALAGDDFKGAQHLSLQAIAQYPENQDIKKYAYVLAPPKITSVKRNPPPDRQANRNWIEQNRTEYRGRWVALKNGQLLADGKNIDDLVSQVGSLKNTGIFVTAIY